MNWEAGAAGWPRETLESPLAERPLRKEFLQFLSKQMTYLYEFFLVWMQKSFSGKAEATFCE